MAIESCKQVKSDGADLHFDKAVPPIRRVALQLTLILAACALQQQNLPRINLRKINMTIRKPNRNASVSPGLF